MAGEAGLPDFLDPAEGGVRRAAEKLRAGALVAVPTETVYGLAGLAGDEAAVRAIFAVKGRPLIDPLIVHAGNWEQAERTGVFPEAARRLGEAFWPGPLTLVVARRAWVPDLVTAGLPTVGVRLPAHALMRELLVELGEPVAAPSANPFGYVSPTRAEHVRASLGARVPWVLDGGACAHGLESTIVRVTGDEAVLLRPGPVAREDIEACLGQALAVRGEAEQAGRTGSGRGMESPGLLTRHYSPGKPVKLFTDAGALPVEARGAGSAVVFLARPAAGLAGSAGRAYWLSEGGELAEAARNFFDLLRRLDAQRGVERIFLQRAPEGGLGAALNDRMRRAAADGP